MSSGSGAAKLAKLRQLMQTVHGPAYRKVGVQAVIITSEDAHQSEFICERDERRRYISGFKGSMGTAIITKDEALLWTDGRYFMQALSELDPPEAWTLMKEGETGTPTKEAWLVANLPEKSVVGADPNCMSNTNWTFLQTQLWAAGLSLAPLEKNIVDMVWGDERPQPVLNPIVSHPLIYSGQSAGEKIQRCRKVMEENRADILVISELDEVAYLLNWRGSDVPFNPVFFAYVILVGQQVHIFVDRNRLTSEAEQQLKQEGVDATYHSYDDVHVFLKEACRNLESESTTVWIPHSSNHALHSDCSVRPRHTAISPVNLMKCKKNDVEIKGMKSAHIRDAVALVKFYAWLEKNLKDPTDNSLVITEISAAEQLEKFRSEEDHYIGPSFPTISCVGPHGAIVHYRPCPASDVPLSNRELYLCDAGAQFLDGTTDVTRTLHFGEPSRFERECFTRVFKGQCNLSTTKFPFMIKGNYLDTLARKSLWDVGLDYLHGTGHGVGAYLNVHEGPCAITWRPAPDDPGLQPGMFLSNEPGYYEDGEFGIRLENIELVVETNTTYSRKGRQYLTFETVTLVPIQTRMLEMSLLNETEIQYLNNYHQKCCNILEPLLQGPENAEALAWLKKETQPISL